MYILESDPFIILMYVSWKLIAVEENIHCIKLPSLSNVHVFLTLDKFIFY